MSQSYVFAIMFLGWATASAAAVVSPTSAPTPMPVQIIDHLYTLDNGAMYQCAHNITKNALMGQCEDGNAPEPMRTIILNTNSKKQNWVTICGEACIKANASPVDPNRQCVGFVRRAADRCVLMQCNKGSTRLGPASRAPRPRGRGGYSPLIAVMEPECFDAVPTNSPTTASPTRRPTIAHCAVQGMYKDEFRTLEGYPSGMTQFTEVKPNYNLCEMVRPTTFKLGIEIVSNFTCSLEACIRWCNYASLCTFAMWSPVEQKCYRANNLELTDDPLNFKSYWSGKWQVYMRNTQTAIRYYSGMCNEMVRVTCNADKECHWNGGKMGYNDPIQGGGAGGYCGRIRCFAASSG